MLLDVLSARTKKKYRNSLAERIQFLIISYENSGRFRNIWGRYDEIKDQSSNIPTKTEEFIIKLQSGACLS